MAEKTAPKEVQSGQAARIALNPLQSRGALQFQSMSRPDGYDGTVPSDQGFNDMNALRQMAIRTGKLA